MPRMSPMLHASQDFRLNFHVLKDPHVAMWPILQHVEILHHNDRAEMNEAFRNDEVVATWPRPRRSTPGWSPPSPDRAMIGAMDNDATPMTLAENDPLAIEVLLAIRGGDMPTLERLLAEHPGLERVRVAGRKGGWRNPLRMVTDWPGFFPNGPEIVRLLIAAGADPNEREIEPRSETPLHWAASSDDVEVAEALIDAGADIHGPEGSIGTPLANAVGYGCWQVARLLVARGARIEELWHAAALGDRGRLEELLNADPAPTLEQINPAFWHACRGGHVRIAATLLERGADINFALEEGGGQTPIQAVEGADTRHQAMLTWLKDHGAVEPS
jgi:uncharacterized protein